MIIAGDGLIITNSHVIEGAKRVRLTFAEGNDTEAQVLGARHRFGPSTHPAAPRNPDTGAWRWLGSSPRAVRIGGIEVGGPAAWAGLQEGDVLLSLDGTAVTGTDDLTKLLGTERIGRETLVSFVRGGKLQRASLRAIERGR